MARRLQVGTVMTEGTLPMTSALSPREAGLEAAFVKHYPRVFGILLRLVGDCGQAEELASEVFLKLYRQPWFGDMGGLDASEALARDMPAPTGLSGWLYRTATNVGIDHLRAAARRHCLPEFPPSK